jgi:hypothetical protein
MAADTPIADIDVQEQRAALAEACGLRAVRRRTPNGEHYAYEDADGEEICLTADWQPDWNIDQALRAADALYAIAELLIQPDVEMKKTVYQFRGVCRTPASQCAVYLRGRTCDNASEAVFDGCLQALERRRLCRNATA